ncbi:MAG: hypothetical protein O9346_12900, partial [Leptospiraceae bacterium]|nr:hypothetical protein [Leptospiraceae bacterium]
DTTGNSLDVPFFTLLYQYSKIPDSEGKQASTLALMYYQHQQVKRAGAFLGFGIQVALGFGIKFGPIIADFMALETANKLFKYGQIFATGSIIVSLLMDDPADAQWTYYSVLYPNSVFAWPVPTIVRYVNFLRRSYNAML